ERLSRRVGSLDFKVEGIHSEFSTYLLGKLNSQTAYSSISILGQYKDFIDERVAPPIFEAESERKHKIADRFIINIDYPNSSDGFISYYFIQRFAHALFIERILVEHIEGFYESEQKVDVSMFGRLEIGLH